jgi:hypothetical protein
MTENPTDQGDRSIDDAGATIPALAQSAPQPLRASLGRLFRFLPGFGMIWRSGVVLSAVSLLFVIAGRGGLIFASKIEVLPLADGVEPPAGIIYFLPRTVIRVDADFHIRRCDVHRKEGSTDLMVDLDATVGAKIERHVEPDFGRGYVIKADSAGGALWDTDFRVDIADGLLKRFGVVAVSTIDPVRSTIRSAALVMAPQPPPTGPAAPDDEPIRSFREKVCGQAVIDALDPKAANRDTRALNLNRRFVIEPGASCPSGSETVADNAAALVCNIRGTETVGSLLQTPGEVAQQLARFTLSIQVRNANRAAKRRPLPADQGLVYRLAGSAMVSVCQRNCDGGSGSRVLAEEFVVVPQFGVEASMPLERRLFSNRTTQLEFGQAGELVSIRFIDAAVEGAKNMGEKANPLPKQPARPEPER